MTNDQPYRGLFGARVPSKGLLDTMFPPSPGDRLLDSMFPPEPFGLPLTSEALLNALASPPLPAPSLASVVAGLLSPAPPPPSLAATVASIFGIPPAPKQTPLGLLGLAEAFGSPSANGLPKLSDPPRMTNAFANHGLPTSSGAPRMTNAFAPNYGIPTNPTPSATALPDTRRKTFFSFHFDDSFRVNQVRKSGLIRSKRGGRQPVWWHDSSIWEKAKKFDDAALRRLILKGLEYTSVTCVLAGEHTWEREWVRFEIASSVRRGNGLATVYIHNLQCPNSGLGNPGPNPLDFMGVYLADDGKTYLCEKLSDGRWVQYDKITQPINWPKYLPRQAANNWAQPLSKGASAYDYDQQQGYENMSIWVQDAAVAAGR